MSLTCLFEFTCRMVPDDFEPDLYDRRAYLSWARKQVSKFRHAKAPPKAALASLEKNYEAFFEVTRRIGKVQKGKLSFVRENTF